MNLSEFSAWFEGFTENMDGPPNKKQWARIQKRVAEIVSDPTPWPIFVERYVRPYRYHWCDDITWRSPPPTITVGTTSVPNDYSVSSTNYFAGAGQAEYSSLTAQ